ncbi:hypothetical protein C6P45_001015 [Maudiozyma exigua]|uniref:RRM domain-containing protein n=1 Tax=Maudiozyma exigua TaxID=34358 RepID=A0A9P7BBW8_MAUEX|nr:hypothetical protein C6P45_001015 [Kazachstania exigua]
MEQFSTTPSLILNDISLEQIDRKLNAMSISTDGKSKVDIVYKNNENELAGKQNNVHFKKSDIKEPCNNTNNKNIIRNENMSKLHTNKKRHDSRSGSTTKVKLIALYIGGLNESVTEDDLKIEFGKYSSLTSVKICYDSKTGHSLGYGYLNFKNQSDVDLCTEEYNYNVVFGNEVKIMPSLRNSLYRKNIGTNVFFSNLPVENKLLTTRAFYDTFKTYGKILSCKLDSRKNIGFVYFADDKAATKVIEDYNNKQYFGSTIVCGLHFDKELRNFPDFDKTKLNLDQNIILQDELSAVGSDCGSDFKLIEEKPLVHPNAIFIKNLPKETTSEQLLEYFCKIGPIKSVYTSDGHEKFPSKWAFLTYKKLSDSHKAIALLNDSKFNGNQIYVTKARPRRYNAEKRTTEFYVILSGMGTICTRDFLEGLCSQERLYFNKFKVTKYNQNNGTFSGLLSCKNVELQNKILQFLNDRLVGGCVIHARLPESLTELELIKQELDLSSEESSLERPKKARNNEKADHIREPLPDKALSKFVPDNSNQLQYFRPNQLNEKTQLSIVEEKLKKQVRKSMNFLQIFKNDDEDMIGSVANYILDVYWCNDICSLQRFLIMLKTNIQYEDILHKQITEALKSLGFFSEPSFTSR